MNEDMHQQRPLYRLCESIPILGKPIIVVWDYMDKAIEEHGTFWGRVRGLGAVLLLVAALAFPVVAAPIVWEVVRHWVLARLAEPDWGGQRQAFVEAKIDTASYRRWGRGRHAGAYGPASVEAVTICDAVPFVGAGVAGFLGLTDASDGPSIIVKGMLSGFEPTYFDSDLLKSGTKYRADVSTPGDVSSVYTVASGAMTLVVVSIESPDASHPRYGLIPLAEYDHFLQSFGR
jgi:hypothetical protein